jgi:GNAT superfamily N-acetyltransferase
MVASPYLRRKIALPHRSVCEHHAFPAALDWQAVSLMRVAWPSIRLNGHRLGTETYPARYDPVHFVTTERDVLISYAALMWLDLPHADTRYRGAAFGNVFTYPAFRGEGDGQRVVDAAAASLDGSAADGAMLFCKPHLVRFYSNRGWDVLEGARTRVGTPEASAEHPYRRLMRFLSAQGMQGRLSFTCQPLSIDSPW